MSLYLGKTLVTPVIKVGELEPSGTINLTDLQLTDVSSYKYAQIVDANLIAANIKKNVEILGITGTLEGDTGDSKSNPLTPREFNSLSDTDNHWIHGYIYGMILDNNTYKGLIADINDCDDKENFLNNYKVNDVEYTQYGDGSIGSIYVELTEDLIQDDRNDSTVPFHNGCEVILNMSKSSITKMYIQDGLFPKWYKGTYWSTNLTGKLEGSADITITDTGTTTISNGLYTAINDSDRSVLADTISITVDDTNLSPENIKKDVEILGVTGTLDTGGFEKTKLPDPVWYLDYENNKLYIYQDIFNYIFGGKENAAEWFELTDNDVKVPWANFETFYIASEGDSTKNVSFSGYNSSLSANSQYIGTLTNSLVYNNGVLSSSISAGEYISYGSSYNIPLVKGKHSFKIKMNAYDSKNKEHLITEQLTNLNSIGKAKLDHINVSDRTFKINDNPFTDSDTITLPDYTINEYNITLSELGQQYSTLPDGITGLKSSLTSYIGTLAFSGYSYPYTFESDGSYPFTRDNKTLTSTCNGVDSGYSWAKISFTLDSDQEITLLCKSYGESDFDYGLVSQLDQELTKSNDSDGTTGSTKVLKNFSGESSADFVDVSFGTISAGDHFFTIKYKKDSSGNMNDDNFVVVLPWERTKVDSGYYLPSTITVTDADTNEVLTDYTYDPYTGDFEIPMAHSWNMAAIASTVGKILERVSYNINVDTGILNLSSDNATSYTYSIDNSTEATTTGDVDLTSLEDKKIHTITSYASADGYQNSKKNSYSVYKNMSGELAGKIKISDSNKFSFEYNNNFYYIDGTLEAGSKYFFRLFDTFNDEMLTKIELSWQPTPAIFMDSIPPYAEENIDFGTGFPDISGSVFGTFRVNNYVVAIISDSRGITGQKFIIIDLQNLKYKKYITTNRSIQPLYLDNDGNFIYIDDNNYLNHVKIGVDSLNLTFTLKKSVSGLSYYKTIYGKYNDNTFSFTAFSNSLNTTGIYYNSLDDTYSLEIFYRNSTDESYYFYKQDNVTLEELRDTLINNSSDNRLSMAKVEYELPEYDEKLVSHLGKRTVYNILQTDMPDDEDTYVLKIDEYSDDYASIIKSTTIDVGFLPYTRYAFLPYMPMKYKNNFSGTIYYNISGKIPIIY